MNTSNTLYSLDKLQLGLHQVQRDCMLYQRTAKSDTWLYVMHET